MTIVDYRSPLKANTIDRVAFPVRLWLIEITQLRASPFLQFGKDLLPLDGIDRDGTHARERCPVGDDLRRRDRSTPLGHHAATHRFSARRQTVLDNAPRSLSAPQRADSGPLQELEAPPPQSLLHAITVAK